MSGSVCEWITVRDRGAIEISWSDQLRPTKHEHRLLNVRKVQMWVGASQLPDRYWYKNGACSTREAARVGVLAKTWLQTTATKQPSAGPPGAILTLEDHQAPEAPTSHPLPEPGTSADTSTLFTVRMPPFNINSINSAEFSFEEPEKIDSTPATVSENVITVTDTLPSKDDGVQEEDEEEDPWALPQIQSHGPKWSELDPAGKMEHVLKGIVMGSLLIALLYFFVCSLDVLSSAFQLVGGKVAGDLFGDNTILANPIAGLMLGVLVTILVQSSSTSSSIVVSMVSSGLLNVKASIPIIMGVNVGTSVTSTLVSLAQSGEQNEFRRAFAGSAVHGIFNWMTVIILFPTEVGTGLLYHVSKACIESFNIQSGETSPDILKVITEPFTQLIIKLDQSVISAIATGETGARNRSLIQKWCEFNDIMVLKNVTVTNQTDCEILHCFEMGNETVTLKNETETKNLQLCHHIFVNTTLSDTAVGVILLIASLLVLCICLILIVKLLNTVLKGKMAQIMKKVINTGMEQPSNLNFPATPTYNKH
ncbi:sodium-dependent phosphate transport protein 2B-like [Carcharodon carcharias]|uniref:sodium-dependent phosphate transport protein 2B-like n=1 Tax=Carcharodon carcharias TaxID=13397 RepID=UPI001B7E39F7|nr:sodium-dependent phosphate transport protein 2B-like [Carcharodon carcharias]